TMISAAPIEKDGKWVLGITGGDIKMEPVGVGEAVNSGAGQTWLIVESTLSYLRDLVLGRQSLDQLHGVIAIAQVAGKAAQLGLDKLLFATAAVSVMIGLFNLFPIPLLDGGHLLFYAIEFVRGRPLSDRAQEVGFRIGLAIVLMLLIFTVFNDWLHPIGS